MDVPLYRTKDSQKVQASLYPDRLELLHLGANLLNAPGKIDLANVEEIQVLTPGPGADPKNTSLSLKIKGEPALTLPDLDTAEAHNLKEAIERAKSAPLITVGGRVTQKLQKGDDKSQTKSHPPISRFGMSRF